MNRVHRIKATFLKALAHPLRLQILESLCRRRRSVGELAARLGADQPSVSRHLGILQQGGLVVRRRTAAGAAYEIQNAGMTNFLKKVTELLKRKLQADRDLLKRVAGEQKVHR